MSIHLGITPTGRLVAVESVAETGELADATRDAELDQRLEKKIVQRFAASQAEGLFGLAAERLDRPSHPSLAYWRDFAARYLTELCHTPDIRGAAFEALPPPAAADLTALVWNSPPMQGAEYLTEAVLTEIWTDLDAWVRREVERHAEGLAGFLKDRAALWHQVGRVCFHLAENRRDPDYPFAFLATYAPGLTGAARVQYLPL
ncbi:MAG: hypothetical protein MUE50_15750, partial [Pirellulaceae bacterium]|nr:hypothetical protein [Pirellulaceae bacterium]